MEIVLFFLCWYVSGVILGLIACRLIAPVTVEDLYVCLLCCGPLGPTVLFLVLIGLIKHLPNKNKVLF
jgi:hypothetical protein